MHYKFLDSKDIDRVMVDGTIMVSSLEYFRGLEEAEWADIADALEGASELTIGENFVLRESSPELARANSSNLGRGMFDTFAKVSGGGQIDISGSRFVHQIPNVFIFSVASGDLGDLTTKMCVTAKRPYDACLKVLDIKRLGEVIFQSGQILDPDCRVDEIFNPCWIGPVQYKPRSRDIQQGPTIDPSPFVKANRFSGQSEVRMLFDMKEGIEIKPNRIIIKFPNPADLFEEQFRDFVPIRRE